MCYHLITVETVGVEISLAAMALSVVCLVCGVFLLRRRFISDARRVSEDCGCSGCGGGGGGEFELILALPEYRGGSQLFNQLRRSNVRICPSINSNGFNSRPQYYGRIPEKRTNVDCTQ